jgi:hypothetical protein
LKLALVILLITFTSACSNMTVKTGEIVVNKKVGVFFKIDYQPKLCQKHIGTTIFNNYSKEYELNSNLEMHIVNGFKDGINASGNSAIIIESTNHLYEYMTYNSWNGEMSINAEGQDRVREIGKKHNVEYLVYSASPPNFPEWRKSKFPEEKRCYGIGLNTGHNYDVPLRPYVSAHVFNTQTGQPVGFIRLMNNAIEVKEPLDHENITEDEIRYYVEVNGMFAKKGFLEFVRLSK